MKFFIIKNVHLKMEYKLKSANFLIVLMAFGLGVNNVMMEILQIEMVVQNVRLIMGILA